MTSSQDPFAPWVALAIGNSRLHWAAIQDHQIIGQWDVPHPVWPAPMTSTSMDWPDWLSRSPAFQFHAQTQGQPFPPLWVVSVVPAQTQLWRTYPRFQDICLQDIPLASLYPTLGIDRALAVWAAGMRYGWPALVIDCGTALTITGADEQGQFAGGAILPGVGVQLRSLTQATAALPPIDLTDPFPERWATHTPGAIQSGVIHTLISGLHDFIETWHQQHPETTIIFTGGDHHLLITGLEYRLHHQAERPPTLKPERDPHLLLQGIIQLRIALLQTNRVS